jgi:L-ascorbate metabolism protein UlaG (beta-lactamase superfamily)
MKSSPGIGPSLTRIPEAVGVMLRAMIKRILLWGLAVFVVGGAGSAYYFLATYVSPAVDPAWAVAGDTNIPDGSVTVRYTGTSTLLFSDGETSWMVDGWFTRFGPIEFVSGEIGPDQAAIARGLERNHVDRLAVVIPVHSHFDHAMDSPEVAKRTGAILLGSESTANIGRGWGLDESQIRIAANRQPAQFGQFEITLIETQHFQFPDPEFRKRALENPDIKGPLVPPVPALDYRVGQPYAIYVKHPRGRWLIQGSAGYIAGSLAEYPADIVFLGIGGLGTQTKAYREAYWHETVMRSGAKRIIPIHWDSLFGPIEGPFTGEVRVASFLSSGTDLTLEFLKRMQASQPGLTFTTLPRFDEVVLF